MSFIKIFNHAKIMEEKHGEAKEVTLRDQIIREVLVGVGMAYDLEVVVPRNVPFMLVLSI